MLDLEPPLFNDDGDEFAGDDDWADDDEIDGPDVQSTMLDGDLLAGRRLYLDDRGRFTVEFDHRNTTDLTMCVGRW